MVLTRSLFSNWACKASKARFTSDCCTTSEIFAMLELCEIINTLTLFSVKTSKIRLTTSGTPTIPAPLISRIAALRIAVTALTTFFKGLASAVTSVPGKLGSAALLTRNGMFLSCSGVTASGCKTLAPKYAISMISRYESCSRFWASGTMRGSVVMTPSTSFQVQTSSAFKAAPRIVAV